MAVNKNFVVKNGLEVNDDLILANPTNSRVGIGTSVPQYTLHAQGGIGATTLHIAGVSTFLSDVRITGVTTLASAGGITTTGGDFYVGGDLYVLDDVVYDEVTGRNLSITGVGTINRLDISKDINVTGVSTFVGVSTFTNVWVGGGMTIAGNLDVTGDISYDEVSGRNLNITGVGTITRLNTTNLVGTAATFTSLNVSGASTITGLGTFGNSLYVDKDINIGAGATVVGTLTVGGDLNVTGDLSYDEVTGRNINVTGVGTISRLNWTDAVGTSATITNLIGTSGTITTLSGTTATFTTINATTFTGSASVGLASEGVFIGAGNTVIDFKSSSGSAIAVDPAGTSGVGTVTITAGVSIGLAIALGG